MPKFELKIFTKTSENPWLKLGQVCFAIFADGKNIIQAYFSPPNKYKPYVVSELTVHDMIKQDEAPDPNLVKLRNEFKERYGLTPFKMLLLELSRKYGTEDGLRIIPFGNTSHMAQDAVFRLRDNGVLRGIGLMPDISSEFIRKVKILGDPFQRDKKQLQALFRFNTTNLVNPRPKIAKDLRFAMRYKRLRSPIK